MKIFTLVMLLAGSVAHAEDVLKNESTFLIGGFQPTTKVRLIGEDNLASSGLAVGGRFLARINDGVSLGAEVQSLMAGEHASGSLITNANSKSKFDSVLFLGELKVAAQHGKLRPFVLGGLGLHSTAVKIEATPMAGFVWANTGTAETRSAVDSRKTGFGATFHGGLDVLMNERLSLGISGAWYYLGKTTYDSTAAAQQLIPSFTGISGDISSLAILASIAYHF